MRKFVGARVKNFANGVGCSALLDRLIRDAVFGRWAWVSAYLVLLVLWLVIAYIENTEEVTSDGSV